MRSEAFGRLLKGAINSIAAYEGKSAPAVENDLGARIGLAGVSIQRYKTGHIPPDPRTIETLATAAIERAYVDQRWVRRFFQAAGYPLPERFRVATQDEELNQRPTHVYHNLPAPPYYQFIMRSEAYAEIAEGLRQRSSAVVIVGIGGTGKTSLAREIAGRALQDQGDTPRFNAVVWISDKDQPGTTTLSVVLDEIAHTLDHPGIAEYALEEKLRGIARLLRDQEILLVIDNFETIRDEALLNWLLRLPEPSKAIMTTRENRREFRQGGWIVELQGMDDPEAHIFIKQRLRRLRLDDQASDPTQLALLITTTGGNPKAIELVLGCYKYEGVPLAAILGDLHSGQGMIFDDLFNRSWAQLDQAARSVFLAFTFFPADASSTALSMTADVHGMIFNRVTEQLTDLALIDVQRTDFAAPPRYTLHSLARAFACAQLPKQSWFEAAARERWLTWYVELASQVGYQWSDLAKLELLDAEQEALQAVIAWAVQNQLHTIILGIAQGMSYYCYIRGLWSQEQPINLVYAEAARQLDNVAEEAKALAYHVEVLSKQGNIDRVESYAARLQELLKSPEIADDSFAACYMALAHYWTACGELEKAEHAWQESLSRGERLGAHTLISNRQGLANCYYLQGRLPEAQNLLREVLPNAVQLGAERSVLFNKTKQALIALDQEDVATAAEMLEDCYKTAIRYKDRRRLAEIQRLRARLHIMQGDFDVAHQILLEVIDLLERLGMRRELSEVHAVVADLNTRQLAKLTG